MVLTRGAKNKSDDGAGNVEVAIAGAAIVSPIFNKPQEMKNLIDFSGSGGRRLNNKKSTTPLELPHKDKIRPCAIRPCAQRQLGQKVQEFLKGAA